MATLFVTMNGYEVGEYIQHSSGAQEFHYYDSWLQRKGAVPISLSLPLNKKSHKGHQVLNYFDNLLPDSMNIRHRIQRQFGANSSQPFDLLTYIGGDCVGAIQLLTEKSTRNVKKIEGTPLSEKEIADELRNYRQLPLGMSKQQDFRISLAGAQEKTALLWHNNQWLRPSGPTPTTHILKLPIGKIEHSGIDLSESVENEWLCLTLLREFGLPVPEVEVQTFEDVKVLIVKRFDRELAENHSWIIRHPTEDMCQAHGTSGDLKYESDGGPGIRQIMQLLSSSTKPNQYRRQFMYSVFLFWLLGAIDGHAKNFSILLKSGGRFTLSPLYDVISAYPLAQSHQLDKQKMKMAMALHGKNTHYHWHSILPRHWFSESKKANFPNEEMQAIMDEATQKVDTVINKTYKSLPDKFPKHIASPIFEMMMKTIAKCRG